MRVPMGASIAVSGFYSLRVIRPDGSVRVDTGMQKNLVLNGGLDYLGTSGAGLISHICVGSGTSTPTETQSSLDSFVASVADYSPSPGINATGRYAYLRSVATFGTGAAAGNLSEIGAGPNSNGSALATRSLIKDELGNPTTITILTDEKLEVTYELRFDQDMTERTYTVGPYTITQRPIAVNGGMYTSILGWYASRLPMKLANSPNSPQAYLRVYPNNGGLVDPTSDGNSQATRYDSNGRSQHAYVPGSYEATGHAVWNSGYNFNLSPTGHRIQFVFGIGVWQFQTTPEIQKSDLEELTIDFKLRWGRAGEIY